MTEEIKFILALALLIGVYLLTRRVNTWRSARALKRVIQDLRQKGAFDPSSAIRLPYTSALYSLGWRDFRPKAVQSLVMGGIIGKTLEGKYYLNEGSMDSEIEESPGGKGAGG
jgi:hypothetical protein